MGAGGDGMSVVETRWVAAETPQGCQGYHLSFWACSQPRIAAQRAVCGRPGGACAALRAAWCSASRTNGGRAGALLRAPVVAESGRRAVCRCCGRAFPTLRRDAAGERSLLSDRFERSGVAYSLTGCCG